MTSRSLPLSKAIQQTLVGDGLAVGCLSLGVVAFTAKKLESELSFNHAWRSFPLASTTFRSIKASLERCDLTSILYASPGRRTGEVAWYAERGWWEPALPRAQDAAEVANSILSVYGIPPSVWLQLAEPFIERLGDQHVRRT